MWYFQLVLEIHLKYIKDSHSGEIKLLNLDNRNIQVAVSLESTRFLKVSIILES